MSCGLLRASQNIICDALPCRACRFTYFLFRFISSTLTYITTKFPDFEKSSFCFFVSGMSPFALLGLSLLSLIFSFQDPGQNAD